MRIRVFVVALWVALLSVGAVEAQTFTAANREAATELMKVNPGQFPTMESALAWGVRYYGWGQAPEPPVLTGGVDCTKVNPYSPAAERDACPGLFAPKAPLPGCEQVNPYAQPELALDCTRRAWEANPPTTPTREFKLGVIHSRPYNDRKMIVIGRVLDIDGKNIIVAQRVFPKDETYGEIFTFADTDYEANYWWAHK